MILSLALAVALNRPSRLTGLYQTLYFLPVITPMVPVSVIWKWIYDPGYGLLNYILSLFGVRPIGWLMYPNLALISIIIMCVWKNLGYNMIMFLVGLKNIPAQYYEAAAIDGASRWQAFWRITLPLLKPILLYVLVTSTIDGFNIFTPVYVMTTGSQGAPGNAVRTLVFNIYEEGFRYFKMGYASSRGGYAAVDRWFSRLYSSGLPRKMPARVRSKGIEMAKSKPAKDITLQVVTQFVLIWGALIMLLPLSGCWPPPSSRLKR